MQGDLPAAAVKRPGIERPAPCPCAWPGDFTTSASAEPRRHPGPHAHPGLSVRIINAPTVELIRELTRDCQRHGVKPGPPKKKPEP